LEASASLSAPSGRVPLTEVAASGIPASPKLPASGDESGCETENALDNMKGNFVVGARFANARREDEAKNSGARFLVGAHGIEQGRGRDVRPRRQGPRAANQGDNPGNVLRPRYPELVPEKGGGKHAPGNSFAVLITAVFL